MKASTMLQGLLEVKKASSAVFKPFWWASRYGICFNLSEVLLPISVEGSVNAYNFVSAYSKGWPEHSGCYIYPVAGFNYEDCDKWSGTYTPERLRLLDYLIKCMEELGDGEIVLGDDE